MMDGKIWMESEVDKGSVFYVLIPFKPPSAQFDDRGYQLKSKKSAAPEYEELKLNVLVAEDSFTNRELLQMVLKQNGSSVGLAKNGQEVVKILSEKNFDIVLMDIQMPIMDGYEATRAIREMERKSGEHIPIIGVTAYAMKEDRQKCLDAGMDDYLVKPVKEDVLLESIRKHMPDTRAQRSTN